MSQFTPIARVLGDPNLLIVPAASPYKTVKDLVDDAKQRPGQIAYASAGNFGASHVCMEMFCNAAGIKLLHVPYRGGGPALAGLLGGQVALTAQGAGPLKGYSDEGKLRVLATFGAERHSAFPDAPTLIEAGYDNVVFYVWAGLFVPKEVPTDVVGRLQKAVNTVMNDPPDHRYPEQDWKSAGLSRCRRVCGVHRNGQQAPDRDRAQDREAGLTAAARA